jgi:hypothetical protein
MSYSFGNKNQISKEEKNYINVKYADKEKAKSLGAKWDKEAKQWYITSNLEEFLNNFETKENKTDDIKIKQNQNIEKQRNYIDIKYDDKEKAKSSGAKWDKVMKSWYITTNVDEFMEKFNYESDDDLIKKYKKRIEYCLNAIRQNDNADISIPDYKYQNELKQEINNLEYEIDYIKSKEYRFD